MLGTVIEIRLVLNSCWFRFHPLNCTMLCTVEAGVGPPTTPAPWPAAFQGVLARSIGCLQPTAGFAGIHGPIEVWPQAGGVPQVLEAASRSRSCWANAPCLLEDVAGHVREAGRAGCMSSRGGWAPKGPWLPGHSVDHGVSGQGETWWYGLAETRRASASYLKTSPFLQLSWQLPLFCGCCCACLYVEHL